MPTLAPPWTTLEIARLAIGILTPLSVAVIGLLVSRHLKRLDHAQWTNQKLLEKRIAIYDLVAPQLNLLLCFYTWVGYWKSVSPDDVIKAKRDLDRTMHVYRDLFPSGVFAAYQAFIGVLFATYGGRGHDATILSAIAGADGDRRTDADYDWKPAWDARFADPAKAARTAEVRARYQCVMTAMTASFGVGSDAVAHAAKDPPAQTSKPDARA